MARAGAGRLALVLAGALFLTACEEGSGVGSFFQKKDVATAEGAAPVPSGEATLLERDVEAPDVFQRTDAGLWDGRPSLGGVWVAHSDVTDPERVMIRNQENGKTVIGALFRRERDNPGPRFQISSDAAESLGMLAGAPADLNVTALRREEVPVAPAVATAPSVAEETIEAEALDPVASVAASAIDKAEGKAPAGAAPRMSAAATVAESPAAASSASSTVPSAPSSLDQPYIQLGIFSVEANANQTADMMKKAGIAQVVKKSDSNGKSYWRVLAGPAATAADRSAMLAKVKALGFADAYPVKN